MRIGSILNEAELSQIQPGTIVLTEPTERALVLECARLPEVVASAAHNLAPNEVADYIFGVAQGFSRFYDACPVLKADTDGQRASRLALCGLARAVLVKGLWLLGIDVPEKM